MKDLTENIKNSKKDLEIYGRPNSSIRLEFENQIAILEALQDLQEKLMRIEGKLRNFK